jgi:monothiol glutaredoxin
MHIKNPNKDVKLSEELVSRIEETISRSRVMLFMKGSPSMPMCGFSGRVLSILKRHGAEFQTYDILQDPELREGIKIYSDWPTFPQLYIDSELLGGCDIVCEMDENGELEELLNKQRT